MPPSAALLSSCQLLCVLAADWDSSNASLQRFARAGDGWQAVGTAVAVSLGRGGLAWGRGLHPPVAGTAPVKREGDGRAPAGIFAITALFGEAAADSTFARGLRLPYLATRADLKAIDDQASAHYNQIVDQSTLAQPDWTSCEDMRRADQRYALGAVVAHNADRQPGAGSCIFLHVWAGEGVPTAGCTAMALADMTEIAGWLDCAARPLLVQLPQAEYECRQALWALPPFAAAGSGGLD